MLTIKPIRTEADHRKALKAIDGLIAKMPKPKSSEADALEVLTVLVESYEIRHPDHRIDSGDAIDPVEAIRFALERTGKTIKDLEEVLSCSRTRVWEIMNRKRGLTLAQIRALVSRLGVPAGRVLAETAPDNQNAAQSAPRAKKSARKTRARESVSP